MVRKDKIPAYIKRDQKLLRKIKRQKPLKFGKFQHEMSDLTRQRLEQFNLSKERQNPFQAFIESQALLSQLVKNPNA
jgi:hypothetical protein